MQALSMYARTIFGAMLSAALLLPSAAWAQAYPTKPIKIITSVPSGAPGITARILVNELGGLGQPIVLDGRPAGIPIGMAAAKAPADGYNLLLGIELLKSMTGINAVRIQYNDSGREVADMLAGRTHMTFGSGTSMAPLLQTGKVRALAVASAQPSALYPDLPIVASTLPGYVSEQIIGVFAPAGTPAPIIGRLNKEIVAALGKKEIRDTLTAQGLEIVGSTPEVLMAEVKGEISRYGGLIKSLGITTD